MPDNWENDWLTLAGPAAIGVDAGLGVVEVSPEAKAVLEIAVGGSVGKTTGS
jgi:hypothetical protein